MSNERVETLTVAECRELLTRHHFGRFGFVDAVGVLPSIVPVNYLLDNDKIVYGGECGIRAGRYAEGCGGVVGRSRLNGMIFTRPEAGQRSPRSVCGIRSVCGAGR